VLTEASALAGWEALDRAWTALDLGDYANS
jgi:hypothetical protein